MEKLLYGITIEELLFYSSVVVAGSVSSAETCTVSSSGGSFFSL